PRGSSAENRRGLSPARPYLVRGASATFTGSQGFGQLRGEGSQPPCFTKLKGTLICEPLGPGASNFARPATRLMQFATLLDRPLLLETLTESPSPLGATLMRITRRPDCVGSDSRPCW